MLTIYYMHYSAPKSVDRMNTLFTKSVIEDDGIPHTIAKFNGSDYNMHHLVAEGFMLTAIIQSFQNIPSPRFTRVHYKKFIWFRDDAATILANFDEIVMPELKRLYNSAVLDKKWREKINAESK